VVGRTVDCGVVIDDAAASRRHVELFERGGRFFFKDLNSTNGTRVNGRLMLEGELRDGDHLQVGETSFRFEIEQQQKSAGPDDSTLFRETFLDGRAASAEAPVAGRSRELLQAVYTVMKEISSNYEPCSLVDRILETTVHAIDAQRGAVFFAGPPGDELQSCPVCHEIHFIRDGVLGKTEPDAIHISRSVVDRVLRGGESVLFQDTATDADVSFSDSIAQLQLHSIICVPLRGKFGIQGVLYLDSDKPSSRYCNEDLLLSSAVGSSAGLALENATMHQQILEKERMEQEVAHASIIQRGFLVDQWPAAAGTYSVFGQMQPARIVGGDFYDYVEPAEGLVGILVGDVSGKGMPAALTMAQLLAEFRLHVLAQRSPAQMLAALNRSMVARSQRGMFCTVCYAQLDIRTGELTVVNAGHLPAVRLSSTGTETFADASGPPIGILPNAQWEESRTTLAPGEVLVLHSDGLNEARKPAFEAAPDEGPVELGLRGLREVLSRHRDASVQEMVEGVLAEVQAFTAPLPPHDDCTMIALRYTP
jgi:serine phosphatase RsbU (regulator of sigma subunit)